MAFQQNCVHQGGPHTIPQKISVSGRLNMERAIRKGPILAGLWVNDAFYKYKQGIFD